MPISTTQLNLAQIEQYCKAFDAPRPLRIVLAMLCEQAINQEQLINQLIDQQRQTTLALAQNAKLAALLNSRMDKITSKYDITTVNSEMIDD